MLLDNLAGDVQAQTHAWQLLLLRVARPPEWLEDGFRGLGRQSDATVGHADQHAQTVDAQGDLDIAARRRVLDGVLEQVGEHLLQAVRIGHQRRQHAEHSQRQRILRAQLHPLLIHHEVGQPSQVDWLGSELQSAGAQA